MRRPRLIRVAVRHGETHLKPAPDTADTGPRLNGKKESLVSMALRFDLVREDDLKVLGGAG